MVKIGSNTGGSKICGSGENGSIGANLIPNDKLLVEDIGIKICFDFYFSPLQSIVYLSVRLIGTTFRLGVGEGSSH